MFDKQLISFALSLALFKAGSSIAARTAMIAITMRSSIKVKMPLFSLNSPPPSSFQSVCEYIPHIYPPKFYDLASLLQFSRFPLFFNPVPEAAFASPSPPLKWHKSSIKILLHTKPEQLSIKSGITRSPRNILCHCRLGMSIHHQSIQTTVRRMAIGTTIINET